MQPWQPRQTFANEGHKIIAQCPKFIEKHIFLKNTYSPQKILLVNWIAVLTHGRNFYSGRPKICRSRSEIDEKTFFPRRNNFYTKKTSGQVWCSFDNHLKDFLKKFWKNFAHCPQMKKIRFFQKKKTLSPESVSMDT